MFKPHYDICKCHGKKRLIVVRVGYCKEGNEAYKAAKKFAKSAYGGKAPALNVKITGNTWFLQITGKRTYNSVLKRSKPKLNKRVPTGELALYKEIWAEREHKSEVSGEPIPQFHIWCFSHILPKGLYPKFRLEKKNIIIKTPREHYDWGNRRHKLKDLPEWKPIFELYELLKQEYNKNERVV